MKTETSWWKRNHMNEITVVSTLIGVVSSWGMYHIKIKPKIWAAPLANERYEEDVTPQSYIIDSTTTDQNTYETGYDHAENDQIPLISPASLLENMVETEAERSDSTSIIDSKALVKPIYEESNDLIPKEEENTPLQRDF